MIDSFNHLWLDFIRVFNIKNIVKKKIMSVKSILPSLIAYKFYIMAMKAK
jgi:hypothetical protein